MYHCWATRLICSPVGEVDLVPLHLGARSDQASQEDESQDVEGQRPGVVQRVDDGLHHVGVRLHLRAHGGSGLTLTVPGQAV